MRPDRAESERFIALRSHHGFGSFFCARKEPGRAPRHIKPRKTRTRFLEFCRYQRSLYPVSVRIVIICDNFSPHLTTRPDTRVGIWVKAANVEIAYTPTNSSSLNRAGQHDPPPHRTVDQANLA